MPLEDILALWCSLLVPAKKNKKESTMWKLKKKLRKIKKKSQYLAYSLCNGLATFCG